MTKQLQPNCKTDSLVVSATLIDQSAFLETLISLCEISGTQYSPVFVLLQFFDCCDTEVLIDIADNLKTSPEILNCLAQSTRDDVRFAMAENHNLSFNLLSILACDANPYVAARASRTIDRVKGTRIVEAVFEWKLSHEKPRQIC